MNSLFSIFKYKIPTYDGENNENDEEEFYLLPKFSQVLFVKKKNI